MSQNSEKYPNTPRSITRNQSGNNPELKKIVGDNNRLAALQYTKGKSKPTELTAKSPASENQKENNILNSPIGNSSVIISTSNSSNNYSLLTDSFSFDNSFVNSTSLTDTTIVEKTLLHQSESSSSDTESEEHIDDLKINLDKSISSGNDIIKPLIKPKTHYTRLVPHYPDIMATPSNHNVSLRDALEMVPVFTGDNITVDQFIEGCKEANDMLPPTCENNLVRLIKTKIKGEARKYILGKAYSTIRELIDGLKQVYCVNKSIYQLQGDLGRIYQWENEKVISYALRLQEIGDKITEVHKQTNQGAEDANFRDALRNDLKECFVRGLKADIESRLDKEGNFQQIVILAIEIERKLAATAALRSSKFPKENIEAVDNNIKIDKFNYMQDRNNCQICGKNGHIAPTCRQLKQLSSLENHSFNRNPRKPDFNNKTHWNSNYLQRNTTYQKNWQQNQPFKNPQYQQTQHNNNHFQPREHNFNNSNPSTKECRYCKKFGHTISECRKRIFNNSQQLQRPQHQHQQQQTLQQPYFSKTNSGNQSRLHTQGAVKKA